jgi:hypothetical protein
MNQHGLDFEGIIIFFLKIYYIDGGEVHQIDKLLKSPSYEFHYFEGSFLFHMNFNSKKFKGKIEATSEKNFPTMYHTP